MQHSTLKVAVAAFAILGMALGSAPSSAAFINGLLQYGENQFQDSDQERFIDAEGAVKTTGNIVVGDTIQSILRFTDVNGVTVSDEPGYGAPYQLTAIAELKVAAIITAGLPDGYGTLVFTPSGNLGAGVFANIYERTSNVLGYDATIDPGTAISQISALSFVASVGLGEADDFWVATTLLDLTGVGAALPGSPQAANGVAGLSFLANPGGLPYFTNGMLSPIDGKYHDLVLSASAYVRDTNVNTGWLVSSNTEARFAVPEPASMALMSLGLLLGGRIARRRRV